MPRKTRLVVTCALVALAAPVVLYASSVGPLKSFANDTVADATEVNGNFDALRTAIDDNDARLDTFTFSAGKVGLGATPSVSLDLGARTDGLRIPGGTTAERPAAANGTIRFNTQLGTYELFAHGFWFRHEPLSVTDGSRTKLPFNFTGSDTSWVVPAGVTNIYVKLWGAGGAGGQPGGWSYGAAAGGGGHSRGIIPVTPGETLTIRVGQGGIVNMSLGYVYGGGASAAQNTTDTRYGGGGGGYTGIFRGAAPLLIAGGGGGGGSSRAWTGNVGGAGGGLSGQRGESPYDGKYAYGATGGSQTTGGTSANGQAGIQYQGGHAAANCYGGGGGGGYWGGGGGGYSENNTMAGGGGGSGFVASTVLFGATMAGSFQVPPLVSDPDFPVSGSASTMHAHGGSMLGPGGHGYVVIYY